MIKYTVKVYDDGYKEWWLNGKLHREDGPAIEDSDGNKYWYLNGQLHREDGPAIEDSDGSKSWYKHGNLHREDGPAVEFFNGDKEWFLNGQRLTKEECEKKTQHKIVIDGKTIQLSNESYNNLKQTLGE